MKARLLFRQGLVATAAVVAVLSMGSAGTAAQQRGAVPASPDERTVLHVLNRIGFGARPGDVDRVRQTGLAAYIDQQLRPDQVSDAALDARLAAFTTLSMSTRELADEFFIPARQAQRQQQLQQRQPPPAGESMSGSMQAPADPAPSPEQRMARQNQAMVMNELTQARLLRATLSERQLNEVLVDFWFNHFNVFAGKGQVRDYLTEYEREVIRPRVLGRFRDLLGAVAHSPAMLFYLDNWQSSAPNAAPQVSPQLQQLQQRLNNPRITPQQRAQIQLRLQQMQNQRPRQARGLNENYGRELMELHTLGVDAGYTQKDVVDVARALTGWTIDRPQQGGGFVFRTEMHDAGEKTILGQRFPAGRGQDEGERVLDVLAAHPATARHIAFKLAQRFVADEPPQALVDRVAQVFTSTKGDLREVVRAVVTSPEFFAPAAYRAKVKTPLEFVISAARATNAMVANAQPMAQALRMELGMPLYGCQPPTGYSNTADAWVNTGALLSRMNFALQLVGGQGAQAPRAARGQGAGLRAPPNQARGLRADVRALASDTTDASRDRVLNTLLAGDVSDGTKQTLVKATTPEQLVALALGSPEFQRR
jgi:uncharacterized protein (DUF1800 family)